VELEGRGIPTVVLGTDEFLPLARAEAQARGLPHLSVVAVPHPIGGIPPDSVRAKATGVADEVARALSTLPELPREHARADEAQSLEAAGGLEELQQLILDRGWGDGLPVLPPTPERVQALLAALRRDPPEVVAVLPPRLAGATVEAIAVNAALAGAGPGDLPVILAAIEAVAAPAFNLRAVQTTTHPCTPLIIVNGPIAPALGIHSGANALGQGHRANAVIGRAVRLTLQNVGGARPGREDRATLGHPGKYSYCLAENEAASPWEPLSVERGFERTASTVTVCASEAPHNANDHGSTTAEGIVRTLAGTAATVGSNNVYLGGEPLFVLGPEHARTVAAAGWSKDDLKRALFAAARVPLSRFSPENVARFGAIRPGGFGGASPDASVPIAADWRDLMVIVAGGAGKHSAFIPTFGATRSVTQRIDA
jgi:hypothetical protein